MGSDAAVVQLCKLKAESPDSQVLRVGVRQGGCNGMSYTMDYVKPDDVTDEDNFFECEGIKIVCDMKSLLYLFGLRLDYSSELIGGGFQFQNPTRRTPADVGRVSTREMRHSGGEISA